MELNSRQLMTLALPAIVTYLTWAAVQGQSSLLQALAGTQKAVARHVVETTAGPELLPRDPFAPLAEDGTAIGTEGLLGTLLAGQQETVDEEEKPLRLDGTVILGSRRLAIINGTRVAQGGNYLGLELIEVEVDRVRLRGFDGNVIDLYLEIAKSDPKTAIPGSVPGRNPANGKGQESAGAKKEEGKPSGSMNDLFRLLGLPKG